MKCYRWKHLPTGMYWRPSTKVLITFKDKADPKRKHRIYTKSNLSKKGKIYPMNPSRSWLGGSFYNHLAIREEFAAVGLNPYQHNYNLKWKTFPVVDSEWVLEEMS